LIALVSPGRSRCSRLVRLRSHMLELRGPSP
jgi:hypothetical protein